MYILDCINDSLGKLLISKCLNNPVFIVGSGRSGTSILLRAIGRHPEIISFTGEAPFLTSIGGNATLFESDLNLYNAEYYQSSIKVDTNYLYSELARIGLETISGKHFGLHNYIKRSWENKRFKLKKHWSAKTFPPETAANGLLKVYPNAKFIYIVRNGIEVVHSMTKFHGFRENEFESHCEMWSSSANKYHYLTQNKHALFVRHENLVLDPINFFYHIFNFLELANAPECTKFVRENLIHPLDQKNQHQKNAINELQNRKSPYNDWTQYQKQTFISICSEAMAELNYPIM